MSEIAAFLLPGFKAQAKPFTALGWVISSRTGTGCIGRAPSLWGKPAHPRCLRGAWRLLHALANGISRAVSPSTFGEQYIHCVSLRDALQQAGGQLRVGGKALGRSCSTCMAAGGLLWFSLFSFPSPAPGCRWKNYRAGILAPGNSLFLPLGSSFEVKATRMQGRRGWSKSACLWLLLCWTQRSACGLGVVVPGVLLRQPRALGVVSFPLPQARCFSLVLSQHAANNSSAEL